MLRLSPRTTRTDPLVPNTTLFVCPVYAQAAWDAVRKDEVLQTPDDGMLSSYSGYTNYVHPAVQKYNLDLALEAVDAGAHDILWDYIRRPEGHPSTMVVPGLDGPSAVVVAAFLADTHDELRVRGAYPGAAVFGVAATTGGPLPQPTPPIPRVG